MRYITLTTIVFCLCFNSVIAQSKIELGLTTEGSWFMPGRFSKDAPTNKDGFGTGIGVYASKNISNKWSANIGLTYRYKEMQELVPNNYLANAFNVGGNYSPYGGGYGQYGGSYGGYGIGYGTNYSYENKLDFWQKYPHHYVVVPINIQYLFYKNFFVLGGVESTWLINYNSVDQKPEFNWVVGLGNKMNKLKWTVKYIRGFKDQTFDNELLADYGVPTPTTYRNNMIQLSLSYAIWQKK